MLSNANAVIRAHLGQDEQLLWTGAPRLGPLARPTVFWSVVISPFAIYQWVVYLVAKPTDVMRDLMVACAFYLFFVAGFVYDIVRRNSACFGLTDRRALSVYWLLGLRVESVNLESIETVAVTKRADGSGTITFGKPQLGGRRIDAALGDWPLTGPLVFDMIQNVDDVAAKIEKLRVAPRVDPPEPVEAILPPKFASSGNLKIAYVDAGDGDPIIFLHGVGATKRCWSEQIYGLSRKFRCLALDYRGYGDSQMPPIETISREAYASDVAAVMDGAGIDKAVLCGNSLGGVVAMEFYKQFPQRVESLVLVDSFAFYPGGAESIPDRIKTLDDLGIEKFAATRAPALFAPDAPKWLVERARADLASIPLEVYKASTRVTWSGDYRELLPKISVGALVVWGEFDTKIAPRALSEELARAIPACGDVTEIQKAGHIPQMEAPHAFNLLLADFLS
jgi:3-oxoadipate enol-lactonase